MRTVAVTGATSGIGRAIALDLAAHGFHVIATARDPEKAEKLSARAAEADLTLSTVMLDVTDPASCQDAVTRIDELTEGGAWALVNNAGIARAGAVEDVSEHDARAVLETNLIGAARMTRLVLPGMRRRGQGRIVQMSSLGGLVSVPFNAWYCAGKHALETLTDSLRMETAGSGIHVTLIEPGFIDTPMLSDALEHFPASAHHPGVHDAVRGLVAWMKPPGPETVARVVRRALTATSPRRRYRVGPAATLAPLARCAPAALTDRVSHALLRAHRL
ncbi:SDR family oxidoreductase [Streptomyces sp. NPDC091215]|uniref:SDR family oxidoreductase n=1 Tax=Streptomyces sp. NPDC091215 TaxID=3155192 RepID=UPI003444968D